MTGTPRISVVMAAYNAAEHIRPALDSLIAQTCSDWELIVVDDGSEDETGAIVQAYARLDPRIVYHPFSKNLGISPARNMALDLARGEWVTVLDSDDQYDADRLQVLLDHAVRHGLDIVADNLWLYDEAAGKILSAGFEFPGETCLLSRELLAANDGPPRIASLGHLKPFMRRSLIEQAGIRYPTDIHVGEDFHFLFSLLGLTGRAIVLAYGGYRYTLPFSAASGARARGTRTAYGANSLDDLALSNRMLLEITAEQAPENRLLLALLRKRGKSLRDEHGWRNARHFIRSGRLFATVRQCANLDISFVRDQVIARSRRRKGLIHTILREASVPDFLFAQPAASDTRGMECADNTRGSRSVEHTGMPALSVAGGDASPLAR